MLAWILVVILYLLGCHTMLGFLKSNKTVLNTVSESKGADPKIVMYITIVLWPTIVVVAIIKKNITIKIEEN